MQIRVQALKPVLQKYGPTILTGLASAGVVLTAHLTRRAVLKNLGDVAEAVLFEDDSDIPVSQTVHRIDRQNWKNYIPPAIAAVCTIGCLPCTDFAEMLRQRISAGLMTMSLSAN